MNHESCDKCMTTVHCALPLWTFSQWKIERWKINVFINTELGTGVYYNTEGHKLSFDQQMSEFDGVQYARTKLDLAK